MTNTLATDMLRDSLRPFIAPAERPQGFSADEAEALTENHQVAALILERLASRTMGQIDRGVERRELTANVHELLGVLDLCVRAFEDVRAKTAAGDAGADVAGVLRQAAEMRDWLRGVLHWLDSQTDRPAPPLPPAVKAAPGAAGYVSLDDFLTRLRA